MESKKATGSESIQQVAVLGLGTMGHGIAQSFARAGCSVRCYDELASAREALLYRVRANLDQMEKAGVGSPESTDQTLARIRIFESEGETVQDVQFVTEAVREDLQVKQDLFTRLESRIPREAILATNTASLRLNDIAAGMHNPERAVVTHWFHPPHIVPVVEVVPAAATSEQTLRDTVALMRRLGKEPVRLNQEIPGFLVNRVQVAIFREVWDLLDRGIATAEDIDKAIRGTIGFRLALLGPLEVNDFAGLDIVARTFENLVSEIRSDSKLPPRIRKLVEKGHLGVKTGKGIYEYTTRSIKETLARRDGRLLELVKLLSPESEIRNPKQESTWTAPRRQR